MPNADYTIADLSWARHVGVAAWRTDKGLLQAQCAARDVC